MCVDSCGGKHLTRAEVLAGIAGASFFAFGKPAAAAVKPVVPLALQLPQLDASAGLPRASRIAINSPLIVDATAQTHALANGIRRPKTGTNVRALLQNPVPQYARRLRDPAARDTLRAALVAAGFMDKPETIDAFLPAENRPMLHAAQPFFTTAGSAQNSHHAYPGGLVLHELFNARTAIALAQQYDREYFGGAATIDRDVVVAAALYHDIMKTVVFQWNADGTLTNEANLAGTGAHHVLSGAEAIARGEDALFVLVLLSAHTAPSLGDESKVADWARAACLVAGVDPVDFGLLKKDGDKFALAMLPPVEAFVNNLSDHDYVLSVHAMHAVAPPIDEHLKNAGLAPSEILWHRNALLANVPAISFYHTLARDRHAFEREVDDKLARVRF